MSELAASYAWCRALARKTAGNFYYSFLTLPADQFRSMCALYAFMRVTDDLGDSGQPASTRATALAGWRSSLQRALAGENADHPALPALADVVQRRSVPVEHLEAVITGVEMDLGPVELQTFEELERYCYHVAGAVGLACIHVWGFHDDRAVPAAIDCGTAFQLTNILRDLGEDARLGRTYLPRCDLEQFGLTPQDLAAEVRDERFQRLMRFEVDRARAYYHKSAPLLGYIAPSARAVLDAMQRIYGGLLLEIERRQFDVFSRRVQLSRWRKLSIAAGAVARWWGR